MADINGTGSVTAALAQTFCRVRVSANKPQQATTPSPTVPTVTFSTLSFLDMRRRGLSHK